MSCTIAPPSVPIIGAYSDFRRIARRLRMEADALVYNDTPAAARAYAQMHRDADAIEAHADALRRAELSAHA